jgi:hypothetical protein
MWSNIFRSKTMGKAEVEKVRAMKLSVSGGSLGTPRDVCVDCRDMLTNMIRYVEPI